MNIQTIDLVLMIVSAIALMIFIALAYMSVKANKLDKDEYNANTRI